MTFISLIRKNRLVFPSYNHAILYDLPYYSFTLYVHYSIVRNVQKNPYGMSFFHFHNLIQVLLFTQYLKYL